MHTEDHFVDPVYTLEEQEALDTSFLLWEWATCTAGKQKPPSNTAQEMEPETPLLQAECTVCVCTSLMVSELTLPATCSHAC